MIYVTQGHEKGIGLEIFFKSFFLLSLNQKKLITLVVTQQTLDEYLKSMRLALSNLNHLKLIILKDDKALPATTTTLIKALSLIKPEDILVTLPTSKDQLIWQGQKKAGYTEFFRDYYHNNNIAMTFKGFSNHVLLITDHLPLKDVAAAITHDLIVDKTITCIDFYKKYFTSFDEIIFSGINPHVGENGLLGTEDQVIFKAMDTLKKRMPQHLLKGPYSGDTLHIHENKNIKQLLIYMYHDQALAKFKASYGLVGLNISMGLPFLRISVDHGTAFDLYGKNKANAMSMSYLFNTAFEVLRYVDQ